MDWSLLWEGLLSHALYALLIFAGGAVLAAIKLKWPNYAEPARYGLIGAACVAVVLFALLGRGIISSPRPEITPNNIEQNLKLWADHLSVTLERQDISDRYFSYIARFHGGDPVEVFRVKDRPEYLQFVASIDFAPQHQAIFAALSKAQQDKVTQELTLTLNQLRMGTIMGSLTAPTGQALQTKIVLQKGIPIENMSQGVFVDSFDDMTRAVASARAAVSLDLAQAQAEESKQSKPKIGG